MSKKDKIVIRPARETDLDSVNAVVRSCVLGWNIPERVKRLSLSSYQYSAHDLRHLEIVLAMVSGAETAGIAAWEPASPSDLPKDKSGMLLHGLYVAPQHQNLGIGGRLVNTALAAARGHGMDGLLVKAQADAAGFFQSQGFSQLPVVDPGRDYPHRWWQSV